MDVQGGLFLNMQFQDTRVCIWNHKFEVVKEEVNTYRYYSNIWCDWVLGHIQQDVQVMILLDLNSDWYWCLK